MSKVEVYSDTLLRGLQTTQLEDDHSYPGFRVYKNVRNQKGKPRRRPGFVIVSKFGTDGLCCDFDGAADYIDVPIDTRVWTLGLNWTIELLVNLDLVTTMPLFEAGITTPSIQLDGTSSDLRLRVWDSADALTTVTSTANMPTSLTAIQITRNGATLSMKVNGVSAATDGTMSATLLHRAPVGVLRIARDGAGYLNGKMDYLRAFSITRPVAHDGHLRWPSPRAPYVLCDYHMQPDGNAIVHDMSRFENHGEAVSSPPTATSLAVQHSPVQAIEDYVTATGKQRIFAAAGGRKHLIEVT